MGRTTFNPPVSRPDAPPYFDPITVGAFAPPDPTKPGAARRPGLIYNRDFLLLDALRGDFSRAALAFVHLRTPAGGSEFRPLGNFDELPSNFDGLGLYIKQGGGYKLAYLPPESGGPDGSVEPGTLFIPPHRVPDAIRAGILPGPDVLPLPPPAVDPDPAPRGWDSLETPTLPDAPETAPTATDVPTGPDVGPVDPDATAPPSRAAAPTVELGPDGDPALFIRVQRGKRYRYDPAPAGFDLTDDVYVRGIRPDGSTARYLSFPDYLAAL